MLFMLTHPGESGQSRCGFQQPRSLNLHILPAGRDTFGHIGKKKIQNERKCSYLYLYRFTLNCKQSTRNAENSQRQHEISRIAGGTAEKCYSIDHGGKCVNSNKRAAHEVSAAKTSHEVSAQKTAHEVSRNQKNWR